MDLVEKKSGTIVTWIPCNNRKYKFTFASARSTENRKWKSAWNIKCFSFSPFFSFCFFVHLFLSFSRFPSLIHLLTHTQFVELPSKYQSELSTIVDPWNVFVKRRWICRKCVYLFILSICTADFSEWIPKHLCSTHGDFHLFAWLRKCTTFQNCIYLYVRVAIGALVSTRSWIVGSLKCNSSLTFTFDWKRCAKRLSFYGNFVPSKRITSRFKVSNAYYPTLCVVRIGWPLTTHCILFSTYTLFVCEIY